jgi:hypothetical protein
MAEVAIPREMFQDILQLIAEHGRSHHHAESSQMNASTMFVLPKATVADQTSFLTCRKATKARIFTLDREPSWNLMCANLPVRQMRLLWVNGKNG